MNKIEIIEHYQRLARNKNSLFQVEFDVTKKCNASCPFCFQGKKHVSDDKLTLTDIDKMFDDLRELGTFHIAFSGGEPFIRDDFIDILKLARNHNFRISIITNAMLLNKDIIDSLSDLNIDRITCSFHSINKKEYMQSFGIDNENLFYAAKNNISYMKSKKLSIGIAVTVTNINVNSLYDLRDYFLGIGLKDNDINYNMLLQGNSDLQSLIPDDNDIRRNSELLRLKDEKLYDEKPRELLCTAARSSCSIDSEGNVYPCTFFNSLAGNIKNTSLKNIWNDSHLLQMIRSIEEKHYEKCANCSAKGKCGICIASNLNETKNVFCPSDQFCLSRKDKFCIYD